MKRRLTFLSVSKRYQLLQFTASYKCTGRSTFNIFKDNTVKLRIYTTKQSNVAQVKI